MARCGARKANNPAYFFANAGFSASFETFFYYTFSFKGGFPFSSVPRKAERSDSGTGHKAHNAA